MNLHMYFPLMSIYIYSQLRMTLRSHEVKAGFLHDNADIGSLSLGFQSGSGFPVSAEGAPGRPVKPAAKRVEALQPLITVFSAPNYAAGQELVIHVSECRT